MSNPGSSMRVDGDVEEPLIGRRSEDEEPGYRGSWIASSGARWCMSYAALGSVLMLGMLFAVLHSGGGRRQGEPLSLSLDASARELDIEQFDDLAFQRKFEEAATRGMRHTSGDGSLSGAFWYSRDERVEGVRVSARLDFSAERENAAQRLADQLSRHKLDGKDLFGEAFIQEYGVVQVDAESVKLEPTPKPPTPTTPTPVPHVPTPQPTRQPTPTVEPTQQPETPEPTPSPAAEPTVVPTVSPAPAEPTTSEPTPAWTTAPPAPRPCPFKFVIKWSLYVGPCNETHFFTTTVPAVANLIAEHLGWPAESSRIRATHAKKVHKRVPGCLAEKSYLSDGESQLLGDAELKTKGSLDLRHSHKHKPKVTRGKFEIIFDTHSEGHEFGTWLIGAGGRHMVYRVLADDATLCGASPSCVFVGLWKRRCVEGNISGDTSYDEDDYDDEDWDDGHGEQDSSSDDDGVCAGAY